jgi:hypothetical protein
MSVLLALLVVGLVAGPVAAQDRLDAVAAAVDRAAASPTAEAATVDRMAKVLATTPDALRAARASARLGWGDVFIAHRIAARGGHPLDRVTAARRTGATWGQIAEEARVDVDALVQDVAAVWPDAGRAPSSDGPAARPAPAATPAPAPAPTAPPEDKKGPADEIRDRMIRGGGSRTR